MRIDARSLDACAVVTLRPDRFAAGGEAIARDDGGRVVFVRGALPGEVVDAEVTTEKKDWARAVTVAVERAVARPRRRRRARRGGPAAAGAAGST